SGVFTTSGGGSITISGTGTFTFSPAQNQTGLSTVSYSVCDPFTCTSANLTLSILGVNDAPVASTVTSGVISSGSNSVITSPTGTDIDGTVTGIIFSTIPSGGVLYDANNIPITLAGVTISGSAANSFSFTPNSTSSGNYTFTYKVIDNQNAVSSNSGIYTIVVLNNTCAYTTISYRDQNAGNIGVGNIIQFRVNVAVPNSSTLFGVSLNQEIPTGMSYVPNSIRLINPDGTTISGYTDASGDDLAQFAAGKVRIYVGQGATSSAGGNVIGGTTTPIFGTTSFVTLALNVSVTGALGDIISSTGYAIYKLSSSGSNITCSGSSPLKIQIANSTTLCADQTGDNAFSNAFSGTFGSGTGQNLGTIAGTSYTYAPLDCSHPQDGEYSVANSTDCNGSGSSGGGVFGDGWWTVFGDHTGASNPLTGNPAPTTGSNSGYMLIVNASYAPDVVISDNITNLCPDMNYEYSAWIRNICPSCGGAQYSSISGINPNIAFSVDDIEQYSSGDISYTGQWQQVGFQYLTKTNQTSLTVKIRNNASGGGGNDWALDDISFKSCIPIVSFNTGYSPTVCGANTQNFVATVTSKYNNFTSYKWQKSTDNGNTWNDLSSVITTTSALQGSNYVYYATLTGVNIALTDNGAKYAIVVGTSAANVASSSCSFRSTVVNMRVITLPNVNISTYIGNITTTACNLPTGIMLTSSGGNTYRWSTNATTTSINVAATSVTGIYTVTATGTAQCTASKTVTILGMGLNPCNTAPTVTNVGVSIPRNAPSTTITGLKASDNDGAIAYYTITSLPNSAYGTLYYCTPSCTSILSTGTTLTGVEAASLSFDPSGSYIGSLSFGFTATDNGGATSTATGIYVITLTSANNVPTVNNLTISGFEDFQILGSITGYNDIDGDNLTITSFNGSISNGLLTITGTGAIRFIPNADFNGSTFYAYSICDPFICTTANLVFSISGINDAPFASTIPVTISGTSGSITTRSITGWGDIDNPTTQLTLSGINPISVISNGTINTITSGFVTITGQGLATFISSIPGIYTLNYQVCDPAVTCTSATLTISVSGVSPVPANDAFITNEKTSLSGGNLLANDLNPNTNTSLTGLTLNTVTTLLGANIGVLSVNGSGAFTFVPTLNLPQGVTTITSYRYQVCNVSGCSTAQAVFSVSGVNDVPVVNNYTINGTSGIAITGMLLLHQLNN
ncbi:MAG: tandem-95 repeat protein, partial [Sphingobacteriales bacterium]